MDATSAASPWTMEELENLAHAYAVHSGSMTLAVADAFYASRAGLSDGYDLLMSLRAALGPERFDSLMASTRLRGRPMPPAPHKPTRACSTCRQPGHNAATCKSRPPPSSLVIVPPVAAPGPGSRVLPAAVAAPPIVAAPAPAARRTESAPTGPMGVYRTAVLAACQTEAEAEDATGAFSRFHSGRLTLSQLKAQLTSLLGHARVARAGGSKRNVSALGSGGYGQGQGRDFGGEIEIVAEATVEEAEAERAAAALERGDFIDLSDD